MCILGFSQLTMLGIFWTPINGLVLKLSVQTVILKPKLFGSICISAITALNINTTAPHIITIETKANRIGKDQP
jgi:hypothetical protein